MTKHEKMYQEIENHGANLNRIFKTGIDNIALCKKLLRLEHKAHQLATDYCNGENGIDSENWDSKCEPILESVHKLLKCGQVCFVNGDARGYALKVDSETMTENKWEFFKDWGGYGILAPDFSENN
jgi:hypothetical protein